MFSERVIYYFLYNLKNLNYRFINRVRGTLPIKINMKFTDAKNGGVVQHGQDGAKSVPANGGDLVLARQRTSRNENADYSGTVHLKAQSSTTTRSNNLQKVSQKSIGISK